ncbi:MAG: hypothetical protein QF464_07655, partial [Myxococcota bacterium]|nr:hypothetical protein [Myxococcota bacterium]
YCWGDNGNGELGNGATTDADYVVAVKSSVFAPTVDVPLESLALVDGKSCGLTAAGDRYCWGDLSAYGGSSQQAYATLVTGEASAPAIEGCTVETDGAVHCQGYNQLGQLGQGPAGQYPTTMLPVVVEGAVASDVSLSNDDLCIIDAGDTPGLVYCWGQGGSTSGFGSSYPQVSPGGLPIIDQAEVPIEATRLSAGAEQHCAVLTDGGAACWNDNDPDSLGGPGSTYLHARRVVHASGGAALTGVSSIAVGYESSCAVAGAEGEVLCWGDAHSYDTKGHIVPSSGYAQPIPTAVDGVPHLVGATDVAVSVFGGNSSQVSHTYVEHGCALIGDAAAAEGPRGEVWCWGDNNYGQLGDGTISVSRPEAAPVIDIQTGVPLEGVKDIAVVWSTTCALKASDGTMVCGGGDYSGLMGNGEFPGQIQAAPIPNVADAEALTGGVGHFCMLGSGTAACWGDGADWALGNGSTSDKSTPQPVAWVSGITELSAGAYGTCAITDQGLFCWGDSNYDKLGQGLYYSPDYLDVIGLDGPIPE